MCILCSIQKWARGVAMMLPWFVIPLIGLWALSQLLPPPFRFEVTSPRLACVIVLLVTLFWYEFLMPQLSAWRVRRNARLQEMRRWEAIELHKLKKTATRRCRNCLTPYKDQNPGGGRFMCSYCGHISKRPVLDLPLPHGMGNLSPGLLKDLVGKSGNVLNGNEWICNGQDNLESANWIGDSLHMKSEYWRNSKGAVCGFNENCMTEKSYSHIIISACKLLRSSLSSTWWLCAKVFRVGSLDDDVSVDGNHVGKPAQKGENGNNIQESKTDKARRKAEEKRQARIEKEQLEEEERKQREEVARLVEERRKFRDETEKDGANGSGPIRERMKKDSDKKRQDKKKERDRGSCRSNSDVDELDRKAKESELKRNPERKGDSGRWASPRSGMDSEKGYNMEPGNTKVVIPNFSRAYTGARYLDRVKGTFLSSSKAFSRSNLFGTSASNRTSGSKENRFDASMNYAQIHANWKPSRQSDHAIGSVTSKGCDMNNYKHMSPNSSSTVPPKKSWGQLFSRSATSVSSSPSNVISRPHPKDPSNSQSLPAQSFDNPLDFGLPSPFTLSSFPNVSVNTSSGFHAGNEYAFPLPGGSPKKLLPEEPELFEDPCYVPDPVSLLGPVSESLDNFQLDMGAGFGKSNIYGKSFGLGNVSAAPCEVVRPSPIESPQSRLRVNDDRYTNLSWHANSHKAQNMGDSGVADTSSDDKNGTWRMWNSSPLVHDGIIGGSLNWLLSDDSFVEDSVKKSSCQSTGSLFSSNDPVLSVTSVKAISRNSQNGGDITSSFLTPVDHDMWFPPLSDSDNHFGRRLHNEVDENMVTFGSPKKSANSSPSDQSPVNSLSKNQWAANRAGEVFSGSSTAVVKPPVGGLYSTPDVQSLWSV